jgi:transposase-like protein
MAERSLHVHHVTIWRWVQRYAPELNRRCRQKLRTTNGSWRVDETYLRIGGKWTTLPSRVVAVCEWFLALFVWGDPVLRLVVW